MQTNPSDQEIFSKKEVNNSKSPENINKTWNDTLDQKKSMKNYSQPLETKNFLHARRRISTRSRGEQPAESYTGT